MARNVHPTVQEVLRLMEEIAPTAGALPGDPVGLQCGDPRRRVETLMFALDATEGVVRQAVRAGAELLVTHHPLLYEPLAAGGLGTPAGRALREAVKGDLAVYSAHTNLDAAPEGVNAALADAVGLRGTRPLEPAARRLFKVVTFVPEERLDTVRNAAFSAGAGRMGGYTRCSFSGPGEGTFLPGPSTRPAVGKPGRFETAAERRLELLAEENVLRDVVAALRERHPYEEPPVDVYSLEDGAPPGGMGLVGDLPETRTVLQVYKRLVRVFQPGCVRVVGSPAGKVRRAAVCAGSGASLLQLAVSAGARLLVTGDVRYHDARAAREAGVVVLDVGHFAPERYGMVRLAAAVKGKIAAAGWAVRTVMARERDPFRNLAVGGG